MWICLNDAFYSIIRPADVAPGHLLVRARRPGDIERHFPGAEVTRTPGRDYLYRAQVPAADVGRVLAEVVANITYSNFKASVRDGRLHDAYLKVWGTMVGIQD